MRRFEKSDIDAVNAWQLARAAPTLLFDELSEIGFIEEGIAVGFLFRTEVKSIAILDSFITNPAASRSARYWAIEQLVSILECEAFKRGVTKLGGWTASRGMARICEAAGFSRTAPHVALVKELS